MTTDDAQAETTITTEKLNTELGHALSACAKQAVYAAGNSDGSGARDFAAAAVDLGRAMRELNG